MIPTPSHSISFQNIMGSSPHQITPRITEQIIGKKICPILKIKPDLFDVSLFTTIMKERGESLKWLMKIAHHMVTPHDDVTEPDGTPVYYIVELSNLLLNMGMSSLSDIEDFGLIQCVKLDRLRLTYKFNDPFEHYFFAALHLANSPIMHVHKFVSSLKLHDRAKWKILELYFGLVNGGISPIAKDGLFHVLNYISQSFNINRPFVDEPLVLLILRCLHEANDDSLALQVHFELLKSQVFSYDCSSSSSVNDINETISALAYYLTLQEDITWRVYCNDSQLESNLRQVVKTYSAEKKRGKSNVFFKGNDPQINFGGKRIILTSRSIEFTIISLKQVEDDGQQQIEEITTEYSAMTVTGDILQRQTPSTFSSEVILLPYGHLLESQLRSKRSAEVVIYFNLIKDLMLPRLQIYSNFPIQSQYRKGDHNWFVFSKSMRHDFYEVIHIDPTITALHWVKVKQPNGTPELEETFKVISTQRYQSLSSSSLTTTSSSGGEVAELVHLNSLRFLRIIITPPSGENPAFISLYGDSEECLELGFIGCGFLRETCNELNWKLMKPFDFGLDEKIVCELPLPSNRGTEPGEMTANTAAASVQFKETAAVNITPSHTTAGNTQVPRPPVSPQRKPKTTSSSFRFMSEHQIKQHAMLGFEQPGYCFYGDSSKFVPGRQYTEPNKLPRARILREGGNGLVLEISFEGNTYAAKRTAFRWREVLIMPKLHHPNVLTLVALLMGPPIENYPRRRYIFHLYPKMTGDLGRNVGSYERYCLRSLRERYKNEPLLLKKIHSNFRNLFTCLLKALHYLHTRHYPIVHRDVKTSNILIEMNCSCTNLLACVCRKTPDIVLSDFDASLELNPDGTLQPDHTSSTPSGGGDHYMSTADSIYHLSPVGTIGFKSPEGSVYEVSNSCDLMKRFSTKADIFSFGMLVCLMTMNEEGPKHMNQIGTLLLSINKKSSPSLSERDRRILHNNGITSFRPREPYVTEKDIQRILPINRLRRSFNDTPHLIDFIEKIISIDPVDRPTANTLLSHPYIVNG